MKAIIYTEYGSPDVLQLAEVEKPTPKDNEVLIKIHATGVNYADKAMLTAKPFLIRAESGFLKPKTQILGADIAGTIEAVGANVTQFQVGDEVYGDMSNNGFGGFAEYIAVPQDLVALKPVNLSFEESAMIPLAGITALQALRNKGNVQAGQKVLIYGASGGVGTFAVQIAKAYGAEVTAVCSTSKMDMVRSIGADYVIDYTKEDFSKNGKQYDLIIAANGHRSLADYKRALSPNGKYVCSGGTMKQIFQAILLGGLYSIRGNKKLNNSFVAKPNQQDLIFMKELIEAGKIKPVADKCYPLNETPDALRYICDGHARGKVAITIAS